MKKFTTLMVLGILSSCFQNGMAEEIVRNQYLEDIDFSGAHSQCVSNNSKIYLRVLIGEFELYVNKGLSLQERDCYKNKLALDDYFDHISHGRIEITEIEITGETCDRKRICTPENSVFQTRLSLQIGKETLIGYKKAEQKISSPVRRNPREGCEYYGRLGGGWICD